MTTADLQKAEAAYRVASGHAEQLRDERNAIVWQAIQEGWSHAHIAEATGLTRGRIGQLAGSVTR